MDDLISRQAAVDELYKMLHDCFWADDEELDAVITTLNELPSAQPDSKELSLTQKTLDTIIRQDAIDAVNTKIKKWNAVDGEGYHVGLGLRYTDVIDTLTDLPSAQPEIIRCRECKWQKDQSGSTAWLPCRALVTPPDFYCGRAERRTDET